MRGLTGAALVLLLATLAYGTAEMAQSQLLRWGELFFPGYHELRQDPVKPACSIQALKRARGSLAATPAGSTQSELDSLLDESESPNAKSKEHDELDVLLDEPAVQKNMAKDGDELDALLEEPAPATAKKQVGDDLDALLAQPGETKVAGSDAGLDALLGEGEKKSAGVDPRLAAYDSAIKDCQAAHTKFMSIKARINGGVLVYRSVEGVVASGIKFGVSQIKQVLVLLIVVCGVITTLRRHHIALRPAKAGIELAVSEGSQLFVNCVLAYSAWTYRGQQLDDNAHWLWNLPSLWMLGFAALAVCNGRNLFMAERDTSCSASLGRALLTVPLYAIMGLIGALYFLIFAESYHGAGMLISVSQLTEYPILYLQVGLYVWVGMLLKRTQVASMCFDILRPLRLPPELLAFVAVVGAALPTAYSGASGIFVIAVGAIIYEELRKAGARNQLALAATAMSGSMGVVLRPCLLVVVVASVNQDVTTAPLYSWGFKVFLLTAVLFLAASLLGKRESEPMAPIGAAAPGIMIGLKRISGYLAVFVALLLFYRFVMGQALDESSAPIILPLMMIGMLCYDQLRKRVVHPVSGSEPAPFKMSRAVTAATSETTTHIGALLLLMGLSLCVGAVVERSDIMHSVPQDFGSVWTTMGVLVVVLVIIGMTMDPYGAVILVSATLATIATKAGIDPVHFWMVVLVAFELGYLTPPVALNHLLTRQVVGAKAFEEDVDATAGFWARHERILLPVSVMGVALILVAFVPLTEPAQNLWRWMSGGG